MTFATPITLVGPLRSPRQMLGDQSYGEHASVHDDEMAGSLGLAGAPIEGPTHFSQFDPLASTCWGSRWFEQGCISAHFKNMVVEGEQVQATLTTSGPGTARIDAAKPDGTPVLTGTASVGPDHPETELDERLAGSTGPGELFIVDQITVGQRSDQSVTLTMDLESANGPLYPFSLRQKLEGITEPTAWYDTDDNPWRRPIIPMEMISVLAHETGTGFPVRQPSVGLFLDVEIRLLAGPVFVDHPYRLDREVVGLGQSRRTESVWARTTLHDAETNTLVASVLLHSGVFKDSYPGYPTG